MNGMTTTIPPMDSQTFRTVTGVFAPAVPSTPIYDDLVVEGGFDPAAMVPLPDSVWPTLTKRERGRHMRRTGRLWDAITVEHTTEAVTGEPVTLVHMPTALTGDTIEIPEVQA